MHSQAIGAQDMKTKETSPRTRLVMSVVCLAVGILLLILALVNRSWPIAAIAAAVGWAAIGLRSQTMELAFDVGDEEKQRVVFRFNKFWGNLSITTNGKPVLRELRMFSVGLTKSYRFSVGILDTHEVRIEKDRSRLLAGGRPQPVRAYVDDVLTAEGEA